MGRLPASVRNGDWVRNHGTWNNTKDPEQPVARTKHQSQRNQSKESNCCCKKTCSCSWKVWVAIVVLVLLIGGTGVGIAIWWKLVPTNAPANATDKVHLMDKDQRIEWIQNNKGQLDSIVVYSVEESGNQYFSGGSTVEEITMERNEENVSDLRTHYSKENWGSSSEVSAEIGTPDKKPLFDLFQCKVATKFEYHTGGESGDGKESETRKQFVLTWQRKVNRQVPRDEDWAQFTIATMTFEKSEDDQAKVTTIDWHPMQIKEDDPQLQRFFAQPHIFVRDLNVHSKLERRNINAVIMTPEFEELIRENVKYSIMDEKRAKEVKYKRETQAWEKYLSKSVFTIRDSEGYLSAWSSHDGSGKKRRCYVDPKLDENDEKTWWKFEAFEENLFYIKHAGAYKDSIMYAMDCVPTRCRTRIVSIWDEAVEGPVKKDDERESRPWKIKSVGGNKFDIITAGYWFGEKLFHHDRVEAQSEGTKIVKKVNSIFGCPLINLITGYQDTVEKIMDCPRANRMDMDGCDYPVHTRESPSTEPWTIVDKNGEPFDLSLRPSAS